MLGTMFLVIEVNEPWDWRLVDLDTVTSSQELVINVLLVVMIRKCGKMDSEGRKKGVKEEHWADGEGQAWERNAGWGQNMPREHWRLSVTVQELEVQLHERTANCWLGRPWTPISQLLPANTHFTTVNSWKPLQGSIQCLKSSFCTYTLTFQA